jgi:hypothetical protein
MAKNKSPTADMVIPEPPTAAAKLTIKLGPAQLAEGTVPPDQARHLITTFGILVCIVSGIGGAVLTLRAAPVYISLAFAELVIALAGATLVAVCGRVPALREANHGRITASQPRLPGKQGR